MIERIAALHRIGEPMDVAGVVVFLASSAASLITGDTILIDGGGRPGRLVGKVLTASLPGAAFFPCSCFNFARAALGSAIYAGNHGERIT